MSRKKVSRKPKIEAKPERMHNIVKYASIVAIVLLALTITAVAGYYFGYNSSQKEFSARYAKAQQKTQELLLQLQQATTLKEEKTRKERLEELLKKHQDVTAAHEYEQEPPNGPDREAVKTPNKPKLAIIFDDVSFKRDVNAIKSLGLVVTMSFLPPSKRHPNSAKLAEKEPFYMVHLPLEAMRFNAEESETLYTNDSQQRISEELQHIKTQFPKVKYINNHTGSKFTADELAMNRLMFALRKEGITFIDSRTTAETKVPRVMENYGLPYIARDVFLDHVADVKEIRKQLKRAIGIAKKSGSAIAICHPRSDTIEALRRSNDLLKEVKLVTIEQLL